MSENLEDLRNLSTSKFLVQYEIRHCLESVSGVDIQEAAGASDQTGRSECSKLVRPFDVDIAPGQVRMLTGTERLTYALVARRWGPCSWLVIPFSDYSHPATETELKIPEDGGIGLRVAQLWNARSLNETTLAKSWVACSLSDARLQDILSAWEWTVGISDLTEEQRGRTGLPIKRRDDVRIVYQQSELLNFSKLDEFDFARETWFSEVRSQVKSWRRVPFRRSRVFESSLAFAAAPIAEPVAANCLLEGFSGKVHVRYTPDDRMLRLQVFDKNGHRCSDLDGWAVFAGCEDSHGEIHEGRFACVVSESFDGAVALADFKGNLRPLVSTDE